MKKSAKRLTAIALGGVLAFSVAAFSACSGGGEKDYEYLPEDNSAATSAELEALADYQVFYKPDGGRVGDVMPYYEDGVYYLYYLRDGGGSSSHPAYMVSTTDFVNYTDYGEILPAGASNAEDSMIGTGSILKHGSDYLFFYTGHPSSGAEVILLAKSATVSDFEKQDGFRIAPSDYGFENDFRDPDVTFNEETGKFDCLVSTRKDGKAVIALFHFSEDLSVVEYGGIVYEDTHGFNVLECPTLFELGGKWYLTYSAQDLSLSGSTNDTANNSLAQTGGKGSMYYLVGENREGPFREMEDPMLDSRVYYAGKVAKGSETMLVGWAAERNSNMGYQYEWGGNLVAHTVSQNEDGSLSLSYPDAYADYFNLKLPLIAEDTLSFVASSGSFSDLANEVSEYRLSMRVSFTADTESFGLVFGLQSDLDNVVKVTIDPVVGKIKAQYGSNGEMASRYIALAADTEYALDLFVEGSNYVLYINGTPFTFKARNTGNKKIAAFANGGVVTMADIAMFAPAGEIFSGSFSLAAGESKTVSLTADAASYLSGYADLYADGEVTAEVLYGEKVVDSVAGSGHLDLFAYTKAKEGKQLTVRVTAKSAVTVYGFLQASQSYYIPVREQVFSGESENKGTRMTAAEGQTGYLSFSAIAAQSSVSDEGRLILTKNGEEIASVGVSGGYARLSGSVYVNAGDVLSASIDYDGQTVPYTCSLQVYSGASVESNLAVHGSDRIYSHDLGVEIESGRIDNATVAGSFGEQGTGGFVYTYGTAIDEMKALTTFNTNYEFSWDYRYTQTSVSSDIEVKADWMKTGAHNMTGVTYVAAQTGTITVTLRVKPTEASGGFILVQLYQNRFRLKEAIVAADWDWQTYQATVNVEAGDQIIFGMKNVGYYSDSGAAAANYQFEITSNSETSEIANFSNDFSLENNPNRNWQYGSVAYAWDTSKTFSNGSESFTFTQATAKTADAWIADNVEIKAGWINSGANAAIAYTFANGGYTKFHMWLKGSQEGSRFSVRYAVIGSDGTVRKWEFYNANAREWNLDVDLSVQAGDTIYIMFFNETTTEGSFPQADFKITFAQ